MEKYLIKVIGCPPKSIARPTTKPKRTIANRAEKTGGNQEIGFGSADLESGADDADASAMRVGDGEFPPFFLVCVCVKVSSDTVRYQTCFEIQVLPSDVSKFRRTLWLALPSP
jgi:hypothetical protein